MILVIGVTKWSTKFVCRFMSSIYAYKGKKMSFNQGWTRVFIFPPLVDLFPIELFLSINTRFVDSTVNNMRMKWRAFPVREVHCLLSMMRVNKKVSIHKFSERIDGKAEMLKIKSSQNFSIIVAYFLSKIGGNESWSWRNK